MKIFHKKKLEIAKILVFHSRQTGEIIPVLLHRTVCENVCLCEPSSSLVFNKLLSNLATLLNLRRYFQLFRRIFANLTLQNLKKKNTVNESITEECSPETSCSLLWRICFNNYNVFRWKVRKRWWTGSWNAHRFVASPGNTEMTYSFTTQLHKEPLGTTLKSMSK